MSVPPGVLAWPRSVHALPGPSRMPTIVSTPTVLLRTVVVKELLSQATPSLCT
jgi:hypothetical protein